MFLLADGSLFALDNLDPFSGASVMSRGIVGELDGVATVASPMYKQRFSLATGSCIDDETVSLRTHDIHVTEGVVSVRLVTA